MATLPASSASLAAKELGRQLADVSAPLFAVLDGALFDNLPATLGTQQIAARSLFLDAEIEVALAGPWLAPLLSAEDIEFAINVAVSRPAIVFWSTSADEEKLRQHLRTINQVAIPKQQVAQAYPPGVPAIERALFRHWDPHVLAMVLPVLDQEQSAMFLGPAQSVIFYPPDVGSVLRYPA